MFAKAKDPASTHPGPSAEMRRFGAGMRVITALLCTVLILSADRRLSGPVLAVLTGYGLWSGWLLWREASGRARHSALWSYWIDVAWSCLTMKLWSTGAMMMAVTLVLPVVLATVGYGVGQGLLLALSALLVTLGIRAHDGGTLVRELGWRQNIQILLTLSLLPAAALIARPMGVRLRWLAMLGELEARLDPRRGLDATCAELVEHLRQATQAEIVALVLPSSLGAPAMIASRKDSSFRFAAQGHAHIEQLLSPTPIGPMSYIKRRAWDPRPGAQAHSRLPLPDGLSERLAALALTLEVRRLHVVPLTRYAHQHGHLLVGYASEPGTIYGLAALADAAAELLRIVERAALVDQLQEESACHERARIGRDLHDSAIQPYLGLKYAVESVAFGIPADNPARAEVDALVELVNSEIAALRELISGLRTGQAHGDNALVPAVRRQVQRFSALFGIDVEIDCPPQLPTTRAMANALFHLVNEVLNNVRKHTAARRVWLALSVQAAVIHLRVRDDAGSLNGHPAPAFRPTSLMERTSELGGTLHISQPDGLNTELLIKIPL